MKDRNFISQALGHTVFGILLLSCLGIKVDPVLAQRPFQAYDPFYRDESARRTFFDGFALTAEVSYHPAGFLAEGTAPFDRNAVSNPEQETMFQVTEVNQASVGAFSGAMGVTFHVDYELGSTTDLSAVIDASGGLSGRGAALSWIALKQYWSREGSNLAFRLGFDPRPSVNGRIGFRQTDAALAYHSMLSRQLSTDMIVGVRWVNIGFQQILPSQFVENQLTLGAYNLSATDILVTQAAGTEAHIMIQYNVHFDPARSHVFAAVLYEGGDYTLSDRSFGFSSNEEVQSVDGEFLGHVIWLRSGVRLNRPNYMLAPFVSAPIMVRKRGTNIPGAASIERIRVGVRFTIR